MLWLPTKPSRPRKNRSLPDSILFCQSYARGNPFPLPPALCRDGVWSEIECLSEPFPAAQKGGGECWPHGTGFDFRFRNHQKTADGRFQIVTIERQPENHVCARFREEQLIFAGDGDTNDRG